MLNKKTIKSLLFLSLITTLTFFTSCSKDDDIEDNIVLGEFRVNVDGEDLTIGSSIVSVSDGDINQDTGKREDYLYVRINGSNNLIRIYINKLTEAKSYTTGDYTYVTLSENTLSAVKSKSSSTYFTTRNHNKTSTIEVLEYDKTNKRIKIKLNAILANPEGETRTINATFYKEFTNNDR